ncbi:hypothetical protein SAY86_001500 [Trapa natans]|uniref:FAD-binding PCMH-type domain-containing protein n=1 Tax=Trapa natans TaxID=22666 RepID=A0AAN7RGJ4_TRANT|nr:hypothetical protein SAY86_001500 [Trapa natans]
MAMAMAFIPSLPSSSFLAILFIFSSYYLAYCASSGNDPHGAFLKCLYQNSTTAGSISQVTYDQTNYMYSSLLDLSIQNLRFQTPNAPKPLVIVTPVAVDQAQAVVRCSRESGLQVRVRSGGHDYEGLSYLSSVPFVILDLLNLRKITVNVENATAWVESGATAGELYYRIGEKSNSLGFPAGVCPTVGVGGLFSGGGYGMIMRKYGLSADNIIDARIIDADGKLHDRESMGEDLFWAIRGGGGNTFGVVVSWRISLIPVPETVTVSTVLRTLDQNATALVHRWQYIAANQFPDDLTMRITLQSLDGTDGNRTMQAYFQTLYLGRTDDLLAVISSSFPELGLTREDCTEMSWVNSTLYFAGLSGQPLEALMNRSSNAKIYFKNKSDYVKEPISEAALEEIWKWFSRAEQGALVMILNPYGGRMGEISESAIPFPHRAGNLYKIQHITAWTDGSAEVSAMRVSLMTQFYQFMGAYVPKSPRSAYVNYRDLDIGKNGDSGKTSYQQASEWGRKYFHGNFDRLVKVKTAVDPTNFFRNEQSIPPLPLP